MTILFQIKTDNILQYCFPYLCTLVLLILQGNSKVRKYNLQIINCMLRFFILRFYFIYALQLLIK